MSNIENFRNLLNQHQQKENFAKLQQEQHDKKVSEENKAILDKSGITQFLQSIIDENLISHKSEETLSLEYGTKNEKIIMEIKDNNKKSSLNVFEAAVTKDKKVVILGYGSSYGDKITMAKEISTNNMAEVFFDSLINKQKAEGPGWTEIDTWHGFNF